MGIKAGVYDSGAGGLTVLKSLIEHKVADNFIYFGDTARAPYGIKSKQTIKRYAKECSSFLRSKGIDFLAVACNTVSALALQDVKETVCRGVIGTIKPIVDLISSDLTVKKVGIIGTQATIQSCVYEKAIKKLRPDIKVFSLATPLFVSLIEEGIRDKKVLSAVCSYYLRNFVKENIDLLLLACTHFPLMRER
ncbi:MAG: glutamate racemase, partial [Candidatus Dadabacteria bacterium]